MCVDYCIFTEKGLTALSQNVHQLRSAIVIKENHLTKKREMERKYKKGVLKYVSILGHTHRSTGTRTHLSFYSHNDKKRKNVSVIKFVIERLNDTLPYHK